ncbi:recombinase family protein [Streptomyces sp. NPDC055059]|uniref:recombinase family protein n=1 Tax=Streptomyces sp. NPDC127172 TaxID=3345382 RepID=UPI003642B3A3
MSNHPSPRDAASPSPRARRHLPTPLKLLREGDTLKVTRLDRLSRSVLHLVTLAWCPG